MLHVKRTLLSIFSPDVNEDYTIFSLYIKMSSSGRFQEGRMIAWMWNYKCQNSVIYQLVHVNMRKIYLFISSY